MRSFGSSTGKWTIKRVPPRVGRYGVGVAVFAILLCPMVLGASVAVAQDADRTAVFEEVWGLVHDEFFDPGFNGIDWAALREPYRARAAAANSTAELASIINEMLDELKTSHTSYFTPEDREYYELMDIFASGPFGEQVKQVFADGVVRYDTIGVIAVRRGRRVFLSDVLDGSPAAHAGLLRGDETRRGIAKPWK